MRHSDSTASGDTASYESSVLDQRRVSANEGTLDMYTREWLPYPSRDPKGSAINCCRENELGKGRMDPLVLETCFSPDLGG